MKKFITALCLIAGLSACQGSDSLTPELAELKSAQTNQGEKIEQLPFTLMIKGNGLDTTESVILGELGQGNTHYALAMKPADKGEYNFELNYKPLPSNRSYPANLDINFSQGGNKKGYLFWALNDLRALKRFGVIGFMVEVDGEMVDVKMDFGSNVAPTLKAASLGAEALMSDTLIPKKGFQMIRPMLLPVTAPDARGQSFALDSHPFEMNYSLIDLPEGGVQFQYNLSRKTEGGPKLAARFYYNAATLEILREGMFAGKFFDAEYGTIKLVYYPTQGQTLPPK